MLMLVRTISSKVDSGSIDELPSLSLPAILRRCGNWFNVDTGSSEMTCREYKPIDMEYTQEIQAIGSTNITLYQKFLFKEYGVYTITVGNLTNPVCCPFFYWYKDDSRCWSIGTQLLWSLILYDWPYNCHFWCCNASTIVRLTWSTDWEFTDIL